MKNKTAVKKLMAAGYSRNQAKYIMKSDFKGMCNAYKCLYYLECAIWFLTELGTPVHKHLVFAPKYGNVLFVDLAFLEEM